MCRNYFAFQEDDIRKIIAAASARLCDDKVEVRTVACDLITGILQCIPESYATIFRDDALASAESLFPSRQTRRHRERAGTDIDSSMVPSAAELHACALSLCSVLLSRPYVIESWTGSVLLALARAVKAPAPAKTSARKALGTFRKTQQGVSMLPLRERLEQHVWEELQDASVQSSYFA